MRLRNLDRTDVSKVPLPKVGSRWRGTPVPGNKPARNWIVVYAARFRDRCLEGTGSVPWVRLACTDLLPLNTACTPDADDGVIGLKDVTLWTFVQQGFKPIIPHHRGVTAASWPPKRKPFKMTIGSIHQPLYDSSSIR